MKPGRINPPTVSPPAGLYTHGISISGKGAWLHVSGQVGIAPDGTLPTEFEAQADQAWRNMSEVLASAGMDMSDLVKVTTFLVDRQHVPLLAGLRPAFLGTARPASTLVLVAGLANPAWLVEIEATAWRAEP